MLKLEEGEPGGLRQAAGAHDLRGVGPDSRPSDDEGKERESGRSKILPTQHVAFRTPALVLHGALPQSHKGGGPSPPQEGE